MPRQYGVFKREAAIADQAVRAEAFRISKADWTELYFDLYRQAMDEENTEREILEDAKRRLDILKCYRRAEAAS